MEELKALAAKKQYSLVEEVSKAGYYWTVLHYASHYGHVSALNYLINHFEQHPDKHEIFNLQTVEGKTPLYCAMLSGDLSSEKKKEIVRIWFDTFEIDLRLRKKSGEDLL